MNEHSFVVWETWQDGLEVGPFYFCCEECRRAWINNQSNRNAISTRLDIGKWMDGGCDWCNGKMSKMERR